MLTVKKEDETQVRFPEAFSNPGQASAAPEVASKDASPSAHVGFAWESPSPSNQLFGYGIRILHHASVRSERRWRSAALTTSVG